VPGEGSGPKAVNNFMLFIALFMKFTGFIAREFTPQTLWHQHVLCLPNNNTKSA
jgi:hypothetical protein